MSVNKELACVFNYNKLSAKRLISLLNTINAIFDSLRVMTLNLSVTIDNFSETINEKDLSNYIGQYNNIIEEYIESFKFKLNKTSSQYMLQTLAIKEWTNDEKYTEYVYEFKLPDTQLVKKAHICMIDNVLIKVSSENTLHLKKTIEVNFGNNILRFDFLPNFKSKTDLRKLCECVKTNIDILNLQISKNIIIVTKAIEQINHLVEIYKLY
jgi:hypothetical protein